MGSIFTLDTHKARLDFRHRKQKVVIPPSGKARKTCGKSSITAKCFLGFTQCMFCKRLAYSRLATCSLSFALPPPY